MPEITAKLVNELRAKTSQGMMECKKALTEVGGDIEKAIEYFRKKGIKTSLSERPRPNPSPPSPPPPPNFSWPIIPPTSPNSPRSRNN
jgi:hypothetical protein